MTTDPTPATGRAERLEATIRGHVQGVGFRYFVVRKALGLDLRGWVANLPDGGVRCVAEGSPGALEALEEALRTGPPGSFVTAVDAVRGPATGSFERFSVRSGAHSGD